MTSRGSWFVIWCFIGGSILRGVVAPPPLDIELRAKKEEEMVEKSMIDENVGPDEFTPHEDRLVSRYIDNGHSKFYAIFPDGVLQDLDIEKTKPRDGYKPPDGSSVETTYRNRKEGEKSAQTESAGMYIVEDFEPMALPGNFSGYDRDGDGFIDLKELTLATGAEENAALAFLASDIDGDEKLSKLEFYVAPWIKKDERIQVRD